jgi:hypothetical protein
MFDKIAKNVTRSVSQIVNRIDKTMYESDLQNRQKPLQGDHRPTYNTGSLQVTTKVMQGWLRKKT